MSTHSAELVEHLRGRRWWTWGDLTALRISNSPWARLVSEGGLEKNLREGETFERRRRADGLVVMRITVRQSDAIAA